MRTPLFKSLCLLITTIALLCVPQASFAGSGHGGGGGFHGGGGGFGGGFHGGGGWRSYGGIGWRGGYGGVGWRGGYGGVGWRGGYGWRGWGYPSWGWGFRVGFGWGWGWYWPTYPYVYVYPYYYPYYPYYGPYYGPYGYPPQDPGRDQGNRGDPRDNSLQQDSDPRHPVSSSDRDVVTIKAPTVPTRFANYRTVTAISTVPRQEVRNVIQALQAMPPDARRRQIESGRYRDFSPEEQELLRRVAQTPTVSARVQ
ncbi:MAG TPA: hypothetical protein VEK33_03495 [Terriglobales bacterium]|nr:hypothetical protein [Terriglobales bacterium]